MSSFQVVRPGPLTTVQDLGRPGYAALGVSGSGAADRGALTAANAMVGNASAAAGLELTFGGLRLRHAGLDSILVAVSGARLPVRVLDADGIRTDKPWGAAFIVSPGEQLDLGRPTVGLRTYLAVRGGFDVPLTLGSRSTDVLSGIGPAPLSVGSELIIGSDVAAGSDLDIGSAVGSGPDETRPRPAVLRIRWGPRDDWFTSDGLDMLVSQDWTVSTDSNRIAIKLSGDPIQRRRMEEIPSEGILPGAIQVPPSGKPVLFLADHPVTGGYPVIAVVLRQDIDLAAQARPGGVLRFVSS